MVLDIKRVIDYVASGSTDRAVKDRILDGPPKKEITKTDTLTGSIGGIKDFALWAIFLALPLTSELDALCGGNANLFVRVTDK